jgi:predicted rRNA methylase YqxC with S4 and FtsJ domains
VFEKAKTVYALDRAATVIDQELRQDDLITRVERSCLLEADWRPAAQVITRVLREPAGVIPCS